MSTARAIAQRLRWEQLLYRRNPAAAGFTFAFPLMFLVIFVAINGNDTVDLPGGSVEFAQFYVPSILSFGLISACYMNLAFTASQRRTSGVLKRVRGTPIRPFAYTGGIVANAVLVAFVLSALVIALGIVAYGVTFPDRYLGLAVAIACGAVCFSALGMVIATVVPNENAASAIITFPLFPLLFISGTFERLENDNALSRVAAVFPVRHLNQLLEGVFNPFGSGNGVVASHVAVLLAWAAGGILVAARRMRADAR